MKIFIENRTTGYCPSYPPALHPEEAKAVSDRCRDCPYAAHGFICWHDSESCMRTEMAKINDMKENDVNESSIE